MSQKISIKEFDPTVLEKHRLHGNPPTIAIVGKRKTGKCFGIGTQILMYDGTTKSVENILIGDLLMGDDSKPRTVLNITSGNSMLYKIKQRDFKDYIVNEEHILSLKSENNEIVDISVRDYLKFNRKLKGYKVEVFFNNKNKINLVSNIKDDDNSVITNKSVKFKKSVTDIEIHKLHFGDYYGFMVDSNQRFLLSDFTVTHNSTLVSDILYHIRKIPAVIAMSGTEDGNHFYQQYIHPLCLYGEYNEPIVCELMSKQKKKVSKCESLGINPEQHPELGIGLLLDDFGYNGRKIISSKIVSEIFQNGRHWKILFILSLQYLMAIPPEARTNIDYVFALRENIVDNQKKLYQHFFGIFPKFSQFQDVFIECTEDYSCLVLDNTSKSNKITDCVYWYRANPSRKYKVGSPERWQHWDKIYDKNKSSNNDEDEDINTIKKKSSSLIVKKI
jgi:hypothetical protein